MTEDLSKTGIVGALIAVVVVWALLGFAPWLCFGVPDTGADFGDTFGAANSLFSAFAFVGVIVAIFLQRKELSLQRKELRLTRNVMEEQATAQARSQEAHTKQALCLDLTARLNALTTSITIIETDMKTMSPLSSRHKTLERRKMQRLRQLNDLLDEISGIPNK